MPFHQGHEFLINCARQQVDELYVLIDNVSKIYDTDEHISWEIRKERVKNTFPKVHVHYISQPTPQDPSQEENFREIWKKTILDYSQETDYLFAAESYWEKLARTIGAKFIPIYKWIHKNKSLVSSYIPIQTDSLQRPISASKIKQDLETNYDTLTLAAKKSFTMNMCIFWPESSGKSTLLAELSNFFKTVWVPEYARTYLETRNIHTPNFTITANDLLHIAKWQAAVHDSLMQYANKLTLCDTDIYSTYIRSKWLLNKPLESLRKIKHIKNDFYILLSPDINFENDPIRYYPNQKDRLKFFDDCEDFLKKNKLPYAVISGTWKVRTNSAIQAIQTYMGDNYNYWYFVNKMLW